MTSHALRPLVRTADAPPSRIAHVGLGAFARSHQAWYTDRVNMTHEADQWGITGFTGRTPTVADTLRRQGGLYHLVVRDERRDAISLVRSVTSARDGADLRGFTDVVAQPDTAVVTLTVSEAGYRVGAHGGLNTAAPVVRDDLETLAGLSGASDASFQSALLSLPASTMPARLALALEGRRRAGAQPISLVPCDNLAANGAVLRAVLLDAAEPLGTDLGAYLREAVSFVDTSIDRITPETTYADRELVERRTGFADQAPVVAEAFSDWVLSGAFPAGRPAWEDSGARFVDDIEPFERRKLWLLNGAHSLMAYAGLLGGFTAVHEAIRDPRISEWVVAFWAEAAEHLPAGLDVPAYVQALLTRFENPRIAHSLRQISAEGSSKVRQRLVPVLLASRAAGRPADASLRAVAAWIAFVLTADRVIDARSEELLAARTGPLDSAITAVARIADERLVAEGDVKNALCREVRTLLAVQQAKQ